MIRLKKMWLAAVLTLCAGTTASAYDLTTGTSDHGGLTFTVNGATVSTASEGQTVVVTVTPDAGWQTKTVTAQAYEAWSVAKARASSPAIDILTVTPMGSGNTWTFIMPRANVEVSATYQKTVTDINIRVEYDGDETELTIFDMGNQQGSTVEEDLAVTVLNYYRTLNGSSEDAYTVCLPYAPPTDEHLTYYTLTGVDGTTLHFDEIEGSPQAYTPYLVFAAATVDIGREHFRENFVMQKTVDSQATADGYTLKGTLSGIRHAGAVGLYILQAGNRWARVGSDTHAYLPPFRAYIEATDNVRPMLDSSFGDKSTGISGMRTTDRDGTERWFDLNGHRVEAPVKAGIYVHNGRKEVVR